MTVAEHVAAVEHSYVRRIWRPRADAAARSALAKLPQTRVVELLVAIPSKRQYTRALGRRTEDPSVDRRLTRKMRSDVNVKLAQKIVKGWAPKLVAGAEARQPAELADATLVQATAYDAATDARVRVRVTTKEIADVKGALIAGRTLRELLTAAGRRLAARLKAIPAEIAGWVARNKSALEPAIRKAARGALGRYSAEVRMLLTDYWFYPLEFAWSRPKAVRGVKR